MPRYSTTPAPDGPATLGTIAADTAMKAAVEYLIRTGNPYRDYEALAAELRLGVVAAMPGALDDAKEAIEAGMSSMAQATFITSMRLAGIEAAKKVAG